MKVSPNIGSRWRGLLWLLALALPWKAWGWGGFAEFAKYPTRVADLVGWTKDGTQLIYDVRTEYAPGILELSDPIEIVTISARSGRSSNRNDTVNRGMREITDGSREQRTLLETSFYSQVADARVILQVKGGELYGTAGQTLASWYIIGGAGLRIPCVLEKFDATLGRYDPKQTTPSHVFVAPKDAIGSSIVFSWSPDGRRIAWLFQGQRKNGPEERAPNGELLHPSFFEVVVDRTYGPRIQIAGNELLSQLFDRIASAIEQIGFAPTSHVTEPRPRDKSVVYARRGFEAEGKKIAAVVPGGATVKPLAGKGRFDVIVALGRSAQGQ